MQDFFPGLVYCTIIIISGSMVVVVVVVVRWGGVGWVSKVRGKKGRATRAPYPKFTSSILKTSYPCHRGGGV
jgi:hypothetical protein